MSETIDCTTTEGRESGVATAAAAIRRGEVVVLPTDTVYGVGADAFNPDAVQALLDAKGRGREMPPPVLVPHTRTVDGLAIDVPSYARDLMDRFWPGPLTLILLAQPSLMWDLGETNGTVALRIPEDPTALALLEEVGPIAVTSANRTGQPAATSAEEARDGLGDVVAVYLDGGPCAAGESSTILDCTQERPRILRAGALEEQSIREALGDVRLEGDEDPEEHAPVAPEAMSYDGSHVGEGTAVVPEPGHAAEPYEPWSGSEGDPVRTHEDPTL